MICELTDMDVSNASVYDSATATAEAMFMAVSHARRGAVLVSGTVNPGRRKRLKHTRPSVISIFASLKKDYGIDVDAMKEKLNDEVAAVIVQNPNFFGYIEDYRDLASAVKANGSLLIMNVDPSTLSVLKTPGEIGADIACGDGQTLGIPLSYGGPYVGFIAATKALLRKMPGRICGMTSDVDGRRAFVLTLQAREQHIRREKATSNICSNQSLMALHAVIYMSLMGKAGLVEVANRAAANARYLREGLLGTGLLKMRLTGRFSKEFVLRSTVDIGRLRRRCLTREFYSGLISANWIPNAKTRFCFARPKPATRRKLTVDRESRGICSCMIN